MSHFYGTVQGNRGKGTRGGSKDSGMRAYCASWQGAVHCFAYYNEDKKEDWVRVELCMWHGAGTSQLLYEGAIGGYKAQDSRLDSEFTKNSGEQ